MNKFFLTRRSGQIDFSEAALRRARVDRVNYIAHTIGEAEHRAACAEARRAGFVKQERPLLYKLTRLYPTCGPADVVVQPKE